ncbi:glycosyltransferase 87 family protein [Pseudomonas fluorescens]|uniref:glycosyltransferase 87 family protein n=1 Tax=Pseudomonas fluorescens TaxID=294 RepID=UPI000F07009E|nr:glycosyltransferase 87 family protein [Pseudomonas fluorescens]VVO03346.1 hypothetical protein PS720_02826 [Pseudomonas fluorescens]
MNHPKKINSTLFFIFILAFTFLCFFYYDDLWSALGVQIVKPIFNDSRVITAGAESYYQGFDPLVSNPMMWSKNPMNYPRVWHTLFYFGLNQSHTMLIGYLMLACYLVAVFLLLKVSRNTLTHFLITCCALSPAAMLGVERGNIDLLIFLMVTVAAVYVNKRPLLTAIILIASTVLKIFPLFCLPIIVMASTKKNLIRIFVISTLACLAYFAFTYQDLILISNSTPRAGDISYGRSVFANRMKGNIPAEFSIYVDIVINTLFLVATACAYFISKKLLLSNSEELNALEGKGFFLAGALIYIGTFFIGNNWDYRLIFLMLTVPTLVSSLKLFSSSTARLCTKIFITALLLSFWYLFFARHLNDYTQARIALYCFDESVDWIIYILCLSFVFKFLSLGFKK